MTLTEGISIIIPLYGDFDIRRILRSIDSIKMQKGVDAEIVVSEQGETRRFPEVEGVKYIFTYHKPQANLSDFNPGKVRNIAILNSTRDYIYTLDADVILPDPEFLKKILNILKEDSNKILFRPFMRRLPRDNFEEFNQWCDVFGFEEALKKLIINQEFLVKTSLEYRELKIFEKDSKEAGYRKTFSSLIEDYKKYVEERLGSDTDLNFWPVYWNENRHCGSNFFRRSQFLDVGGYCEKFINWGCEDSDLQWKFREIYNLEFFPPEMEVIHLDHPKGYVSPKMWALNEEKSTKRKKDGVKLAVEYDKEILKKEYGKK
ncbi:MAG: glycosyltransferase [archaeon]|nr:glycosyltransferase [archaeon]